MTEKACQLQRVFIVVRRLQSLCKTLLSRLHASTESCDNWRPDFWFNTRACWHVIEFVTPQLAAMTSPIAFNACWRSEKPSFSMEGLRGAFAGQSLTCRQMPGRAPKLSPQTACVATPVKPPSAKVAKRSKVEIVKEKSDFLRHPLMEELVNENSYINEDAVQLMKFHGSYQQDHREKRAFGNGKFYQFMMRTRQPGGVVPNQLYLTMDDLSEQVRQSELLHDSTQGRCKP